MTVDEILDVAINGEICIWDYERNDFVDLGNPLNYYQLNELELLDKEVIKYWGSGFLLLMLLLIQENNGMGNYI